MICGVFLPQTFPGTVPKLNLQVFVLTFQQLWTVPLFIFNLQKINGETEAAKNHFRIKSCDILSSIAPKKVFYEWAIQNGRDLQLFYP